MKKQIPFDAGGNLFRNARHSSRWDSKSGVVWKDQIYWYDRLQVTELANRKHRYVIVKSIRTGKTYPMFLSDLVNCIKYIDGGIIEGIFSIHNKSSYFGIYLQNKEKLNLLEIFVEQK